MENKEFEEIKMTEIVYCDDSVSEDGSLKFYERISREMVERYAELGEELASVKYFYLFVEDYCYSIVIPAKKGHKLVIRKTDDNFLGVYSRNYDEVISKSSEINKKILN